MNCRKNQVWKRGSSDSLSGTGLNALGVSGWVSSLLADTAKIWSMKFQEEKKGKVAGCKMQYSRCEHNIRGAYSTPTSPTWVILHECVKNPSPSQYATKAAYAARVLWKPESRLRRQLVTCTTTDCDSVIWRTSPNSPIVPSRCSSLYYTQTLVPEDWS